MDRARYTETAAKVIFFARYEAASAGWNEIQPQHLILALPRVAKPLFADPESLKAAIQRSCPPTHKRDPGQLPLNPSARRILDHAAKRTGRIGPENILAAIRDDELWGPFLAPRTPFEHH
jgi:ATP-dependent Clp protease ATP-binding subunit ClpC